MPQKLQPRGISLAGLGHPGMACSTVARPSPVAAGTKAGTRAGQSRLEKRPLPGWEGLELPGWPRKRDWMKQAR